jgi:uncharacterized membrane protein
MSSYHQFNFSKNSGGCFIPIIVLSLFFIALYLIIQNLYALLTQIAIVLLIITAVINHKVILDYLQFIIRTIKRDVLLGVLYSILSVVLYPLLIGFLFSKALFSWWVGRKIKHIQDDKYSRYEEVSDNEEDGFTDYLELPDLPPKENPSNKKDDNDYDQLFK